MITEGDILPFVSAELPAGPWLVFAPHPDDETFGMGGALLLAKAAGIHTELVVMTDGAQGGSSANLVQTREQETRIAAEMLGFAEVHFLGEPDRGLQPSSALANKLAEMIKSSKAGAVFFPGVNEPHPDHRATSLVVWQALQLLQAGSDLLLPAVFSYEITVQSPINLLFDITDFMVQKRAVLEVYHSQLDENNYAEIIEALNKLRSLTLPPSVTFAEGFYQYAEEQLRQSYLEWAVEQAARLLRA